MKSLLKHLTFLLIFTSKLAVAGDGVKFIENKGQWNSNAIFKGELKGGFLYLEKNKLTFDLLDTKTFSQYIKAHHEKSSNRVFDKLNWHAYNIEFLGGELNPSISGKYKSQEYYNYFLGNDKSKWASRAKGYYQVDYKNIYKGISLTIYSDDDLKYDLIIDPNSNTKDIKLKYNGVDNISLKKGQIHITTSVNKIIEEKPYAYQIINNEKIQVTCNYTLKNNTIGFDFPDGYNKNEKLVIDPTLIFSAYSGSLSNNFGYSATSDSKGFLYSGSSAFGNKYPITTGAYNEIFTGGIVDIAISKFDTTGAFLIYSTYIGGDSDELPHSLIVNSFDELFILGTTSSLNYPYTTNAYDTSFNGGTPNNLTNGLGVNYINGSDIIVSRLTSEGDSLLASTYIGGSGNDGLNSTAAMNSPLNVLKYNYADEVRGEIDIDKNNNIYIISSTQSNTDFPIEGNPFQPNYGGGAIDACIIKLDNSLQNIIWSSYLGGEDHDAGYSLSIDSNDDIYLTGGTSSNLFPKTNNVLGPTFNGGRSDGFVTHVNKNGQQMINSTYYGSIAYDQSYFVELDKFDNVYLFGQTEIIDSTFVKNVIWSEPGSGQFISKITPELDSLMYSTVFGSGNGINISPTAFLVDLCSKIYLTGWGGGPNTSTSFTSNNAGNTTDMYTTPDAQDTTTNGNDFYIMVLEDDASGIFYGSFFGGSASSEHVDGGTSRFDKKGKVYQAMCAGCGGNSDMTIKPSFDHELDTNNSNSGCNLGVFKMDFGLPIVVADFDTPPIGCAPFTYTFNNTSLIQSNTNYFWEFGDGNTSTSSNPSHTYLQSGTYIITLVLTDNATCNLSDSIQKEIIILGDTSYNIQDEYLCLGETEQIGLLPSPSPSITYSWFPSTFLSDSSISNPFSTPDSTISYNLLISNGVCTDTIYQTVNINNPTLETSNDTTVCKNQSVQIWANSFGTSNTFIWSSNIQFSDTLNSSLLDSTLTISPITNTTYYVLALTGNCPTIDSVLINYAGFTIQTFNDTICEGEQIIINSTTPSNQTLTYSWSPLTTIVSGDSTASPTVSPTTNTTYYIHVQNSLGCIVNDSVLVTVVPEITISGGDTTTTCDTTTLEISITSGTANSITWSTNNQFTDTLNTNILDSSLFVNLPDTTIYYVIVKNQECSAIDSFLVYNKGFSIQTFNDTICEGDQLTINSTTTSNQALTYNWTPLNSIVSGTNSPTPIVNPTVTTTYFVTVDNNSICTVNDSLTVEVVPNILLSGADTTTTCDTTTLEIFLTTGNPSSYIWSTNIFFTDTLNPNTLTSTLIVEPKDTTRYYVLVTNGTCSQIDSFLVNYIGFNLSVSDTSVCAKENAILNVTPTPSQVLTYSWSPTSEIISGDTTYSIIVNPSTTTTYTVLAQNNLGCINSTTSTVSVSTFVPNTMSVFADKDTLLNGESTQIHFLPTTGFTYQWTPPIYLNNDIIPEPITTPIPPSITTYTVELSEISTTCKFNKTITIYAYEIVCGEPNVFIPNAFTPNGDGENDILFVRGRTVEKVALKIYDRWGELVFKTDKQSVGWDGKYKDVLVDPGVFVYHLELTCIDGQEYFKKGNVTVIR